MAKKTKKANVVDVLRRMKSILSRRGGWTQDWFAKTKAGDTVGPLSPAAVSFCLIGARDRAATDLDAPSIVKQQALNRVAECIKKREPDCIGVPYFNDAKGRKKSEILAVVDCAIKDSR